jgi:hypothetical protein
LTAAKEPDAVIITHFVNPGQLEGIEFQPQNEDNKKLTFVQSSEPDEECGAATQERWAV